MKIVLFDWTTEGHHSRYISRFAEVLSKKFEVVVAVPEEIAGSVAHLPVQIFLLGSKRPRPNFSQPLAAQNKKAAHDELELFQWVVNEVQPDHIVHMYADTVIRRMFDHRSFNVPITLCLFHPRAHYFSAYNTLLPPKELARAWFLEYLVVRWQRRPDAHAILTLDEEAARRWSQRKGAAVYFLPEPPLNNLPTIPTTGQRTGCIIYGDLSARKGINLLRNAISLEPMSIKVLLAGSVDQGYREELITHVEAMQVSGAEVELRDWIHNEHDGMSALAEARCVVLPYPRHYGMSRVLLEASAVGTPVIAHNRGLLGHLVRNHKIGKAVDCSNPRALREALIHFCYNLNHTFAYAGSLSCFAEKYSKSKFERAISAPFGYLTNNN